MFRVMLSGLSMMMGGLCGMAMGRVSMVGRLFMVAAIIVLSSFAMMTSSLCSGAMMF
jgi:hypothetical protein